jgi:hypothetical protein
MPKKILIGSPCRGGIPEEFVQFRCEIETRQALGHWPDYEFTFAFMSAGSVNIARNCLAHLARSNGMDKLLFVDLDVLPKVEHVIRIVSHDVPVVGGLYTKKNGQGSWLGRHAGKVEPDARGLVPYEDLPTGFLCIDVKTCLEVLVEKMPEIAFTSVDDPDAEALAFQTMHEFFPMGLTGPASWREKFMDIKKACDEYPKYEMESVSKGYPVTMTFHAKVKGILNRETGPRIFRGEDYHFCWFCRQLGIPIYADWQCFIHHKGQAVYPLDPNFVLNLANKITKMQQVHAETETRA